MERKPATTKRAVALRYDAEKDVAPTVVASGTGFVAERIVETAQAHGVAIQENPDLVQALAQVELGEAIPDSLYPVVAEVLVFVSRLNTARGQEARSS